MAALDGLDAPERTNKQFLELTTGVLKGFADRPDIGIGLFTVKVLRLLGLLGGETQCAICGRANTAGTVAAPPDMTAFICRECYNRAYGDKEVSVIFIRGRHLEAIRRIAQMHVEDRLDIRIGSETMAVIFSLAESRLPEMLPGATAALMRLVAGAVLAG